MSERDALRRAREVVRPFARAWPYEPRFLDTEAGALHYVDEGPRDAPPILCLHGNPTWGFLFRRVIEAFADDHRIIVPDHLGCGLSDLPPGPVRLADHVANVERLVYALALDSITLLVHDWGGAIGMGCATRRPERIARLVILNTAAFQGPMPHRIRMARTPLLGRVAIQGANAFARAATRMAVERPLSDEVRRGLLAPYDGWARRHATWRFVEDIPTSPRHPSFDTLSAITAGLARLAHVPTCVVWGERDWCFTPEFRRMWREHLPQAEMHPIEDAGHYVIEDAPDVVLGHLRDFFDRHPVRIPAAYRSAP